MRQGQSSGRRLLGLGTVCLLLLAVVVHYRIVREYHAPGSSFSQMLYLPSGKYLKPATFGYQLLVADFIYLWSIQYYGDPGFHPRMEYLRHTYDLITELDPKFIEAYQTGALFMFYEGRNPQAGLKLLDTGLERNPSKWILPADAGFYCMMNLRNRELSARYFEKAAAIPGAPSLTKRMAAGIHFRMGDKRLACQLWEEVYRTEQDPSIRQTAFQHVHDLKVLIDLENLRDAIREYQRRFRRVPLHLNQLVSAGILQAIPLDPDENQYEYDRQTGNVKYSSQLTVYRRYQ